MSEEHSPRRRVRPRRPNPDESRPATPEPTQAATPAEYLEALTHYLKADSEWFKRYRAFKQKRYEQGLEIAESLEIPFLTKPQGDATRPLTVWFDISWNDYPTPTSVHPVSLMQGNGTYRSTIFATPKDARRAIALSAKVSRLRHEHYEEPEPKLLSIPPDESEWTLEDRVALGQLGKVSQYPLSAVLRRFTGDRKNPIRGLAHIADIRCTRGHLAAQVFALPTDFEDRRDYSMPETANPYRVADFERYVLVPLRPRSKHWLELKLPFTGEGEFRIKRSAFISVSLPGFCEVGATWAGRDGRVDLDCKCGPVSVGKDVVYRKIETYRRKAVVIIAQQGGRKRE